MKLRFANIASTNLIGALFVFAGAIFFSAKAVFVKLAYRYAVDSVSLLTLRMLFALPFFVAILLWIERRERKQPSPWQPGDARWIILLGFLGYYLASFLDFSGLQYISASMERLILFIYPTLVVLLSAIFFKKPIERRQFPALALTYLGVGMAFAEGIQLQTNGPFVLGAGLVFLSALTYAIYLIGSGELLPRLGTWRFTAAALIVAASSVLIHHGLLYKWRLFHFDAAVYQLAFAMALLSTVLPAFLVSEGIQRIGASNAAIAGSVGPISTIVLAYIFLDERLGPWQWTGTLLVIGGVLVITLGKRRG